MVAFRAFLQVQSALKSFADMVEYLPDELQPMAQYSQPLAATDDTGKTLLLRDFIEVYGHTITMIVTPLSRVAYRTKDDK